MLSIEEIKKGCEFADGFTCENGTLYIYNKNGLLSKSYLLSKSEIVYFENSTDLSLFLQRVIEGINKKEDFEIHQNRSNILVYNLFDGFPQEFEYIGDETKEEVIRHILEIED